MNVIVIAVIVLGLLGLILAAVLFLIAKKFAVEEDPRIAQVAEVLPQANCGGCGFPGCQGFAEACVKASAQGSIEGKSCPVGGKAVMDQVAGILGLAAVEAEPKVAVVRCQGSCAHRPRTSEYVGVKNCHVANATSGGETGCFFGCLGLGECAAACTFDALHMNPETGLPEVEESRCTACGRCVKACPRHIIELRPMGKKGRRMSVLCVNKEKGAVTRKACDIGCIGCGKCQKVCEFDAITVENNLAYIDPVKCRLCRKCEEVCPQHSIVAMNFPPRKPKPEAPAQPAAAAPSARPAEASGTAAKETPAPEPIAAGPAAPAMNASKETASPAPANAQQ